MKENRTYRILVVDDEQDLCEVLRYNFVKEGYNVDVAHSAEEALTLQLDTYDLLMLDVMMEGMSGFDMARQIKQNDTLRDLPIIFLTAKSAEEDTLHGFNLGADDYITKPYRLPVVMARKPSSTAQPPTPQTQKPPTPYASKASGSTSTRRPSPSTETKSTSPRPNLRCYSSSSNTVAASSHAKNSSTACGHQTSWSSTAR